MKPIEIPMTAHDRRRVRRIVQAPDGESFPLDLPTGTVLHPGQVLFERGERRYVVSAASEAVLVITPRDVGEAARVGHLIGNLHRDIDLNGTEVIALADQALVDRLHRAGVSFHTDQRAFHGRAPGEHSH